MSELKWPSEEEVRKMFAKKEGFGSDATLSAAMELPEVKALKEALQLAANRLARCALDYDTGTRRFFETAEWADEARAAIAALVQP
jgi:hypothetical protein